MKKIILTIAIVSLLLLLFWTGLQGIIEKKEGYYYINSTFAMMNKTLFLKVDEYKQEKQVEQMIQLARENGIRMLYLELYPEMDFDILLQTYQKIDRYGIEIGYWYSYQRVITNAHFNIAEQLHQLYMKTQQSSISIYFCQNSGEQELILYKDTYLHTILQFTKTLQTDAKALAYPLEIGWVLPAVAEADKINTVFEGYTKKLHFHTLDNADMLGVIPSLGKPLIAQVLNEAIYASRKDKRASLVLEYGVYKELFQNTNQDYNQFLHELQQAYQEMATLNMRSQVLFFDREILLDIVQHRYDLNRDGKINLEDLLDFSAAYFTGKTGAEHDFNQDRVVDIYDLIALFVNLNGDYQSY